MAGLLFADYNGQKVRVDDDYKTQLSQGAANMGMTAQEYDKMLNPETYGARWGGATGTTASASTMSDIQSLSQGGASSAAKPVTGQSGGQSGLLYSPSQQVQSVAPAAAQTSNADAVKALAQGYTASKVNVTPESTVQGQLGGILASDSPLNKAAETYGLQQANKRGLLNSSIAVGAAQDALIKNALPIAAQDANIFANAGTFNAGAENAASQFGASAQNTAELQNAQAGTQVNLANAQAKNAAALNDVENQVRLKLADLQANTQMSVQDKQLAANQLISQGDNQTRLLLQQMDSASRLSLAQVDQDTKMKIAGMDAKTKQDLSALEANNRQLLQTNINAANMYQQYVTNLANISTNTNMDQAAKQQAATNQLNALNAALQAIGEVSGLDLSKYFQADTQVQVPAAPVAQATKPAIPGLLGGEGGGE